MDGYIIGLFLVTWAQIAALWYKMGRVEQHVKDLNPAINASKVKYGQRTL